jgi:hypothetical protein
VKVQAALTNTPVPEPFPLEMLSSAGDRLEGEVPRKAENKVTWRVENEVSRKVSARAANVPGAVIRSAKDAAEVQISQPVMVHLGPLLTLLTMLRRRTAIHAMNMIAGDLKNSLLCPTVSME